jgi:hypothetical protein
MKKLVFSAMNLVFIASVIMVSCNKEESLIPNSTGADAATAGAAMLKSTMSETYIEFWCAGVLPCPLEEELVLAADADVEIFARDGFMPDDVVDVLVDGCWLATIDSRNEGAPSGSHPGETHTVSLYAGTHTITFVLKVSSASGPSGWYYETSEVTFTDEYLMDADMDGICWNEDENDNSNTDPTINIGGCDSGVINTLFENGLTMMDMIEECMKDAKNHGQFVSCVAHLMEYWVSEGLISEMDTDAIMGCAGRSNK